MTENIFPKKEYKDVEKWPLQLALLKESNAYRDIWDEYSDKIRDAIKKEPTIDYYTTPAPPARSSYWKVRKVWDEFREILYNKYKIACKDNPEECIKILDPYKSKSLNVNKLFLIFLTPPAITQVSVNDDSPCEYYRIADTKDISLMPSERLLKIDLSRPRGALIDEFKHFLDTVEQFRKESYFYNWQSNYEAWEQDKSRYRNEVEQALKVWQMRRQQKTYREIAQALNIKEPAAKMAFRRAFELIENTVYDPSVFKRENSKVKLSSLQNLCGTCPSRNNCSELCPEALRFVTQDEVKQRELTIDPLILS